MRAVVQICEIGSHKESQNFAQDPLSHVDVLQHF